MLTCPMCKKTVRGRTKECPTCRTDLAILVDYLSDLESSLERAEVKTRAGKLGDAVWAYLEVLEVDPDNPTAREQVGDVVKAVRYFDEQSPGRRWRDRLRREARFRRWMEEIKDMTLAGWYTLAASMLLMVAMLVIGYFVGWQAALAPPEPPPATQPDKITKPAGKDKSTIKDPLKDFHKGVPTLGK